MVARDQVGQPWGHARDISQSGMRLETQQRQGIGSVHTLIFVWDLTEHRARVEVVRHTEDGLAVRFVEPDPTFSAALHELTTGCPAAPQADPGYADRFWAESAE